MFKNSNLSSYEKFHNAIQKSNIKNRHLLLTDNENVQHAYLRYSLVDYLTEKFDWHYWMVVTFGFNPDRDEVEDTMCASHYFFDRWLLGNNKLQTIQPQDRSRWLLLPEYGSEKHLHFNCFINLQIRPEVKTYQSEWHSIKATFNNIFKKLNKGLSSGSIDYSLHERRYKIDDLKMAMYSTKEMKHQFIEEGLQDNFANMIMSWKDWQVKPIHKRSPKKYTPPIKTDVTLEQFMK